MNTEMCCLLVSAQGPVSSGEKLPSVAVEIRQILAVHGRTRYLSQPPRMTWYSHFRGAPAPTRSGGWTEGGAAGPAPRGWAGGLEESV
jgi:hypothetical protein